MTDIGPFRESAKFSKRIDIQLLWRPFSYIPIYELVSLVVYFLDVFRPPYLCLNTSSSIFSGPKTASEIIKLSISMFCYLITSSLFFLYGPITLWTLAAFSAS
jgi:hypothetical protein